jgi:hypothetical protein
VKTRRQHPFLFVKRGTLSLGGLACVVLVAAACGQGHITASGTGAASSARASLASSTPEQRAQAAAKAMLAEFVVPPGATRLAGKPALPSGSPTMGIVSTTQADVTGYWRVPGSAPALLAWERARISKSFSAQDVIIGPPSWDTVYSLPAVAGVLSKREMNVQVYDVGGGQTVIMAEAMAAWEPPRSAGEVIGNGVRAVTVFDGDVRTKALKPVTVTSPAAVKRLVALVNGLPLSTLAQDIPCPSGTDLTLAFYDSASATGKPVATATGPVGCGAVELTLNGRKQPDLAPTDVSAYESTVLKAAGLPTPS